MAWTALVDVLAPPLCWACGEGAREREPLCGCCRRLLRWLEPEVVAGVSVFAPVSYEGPARALVRALKYRGAAGVAGSMAAAMTACAPPELLAGRELAPVPLAPGRLRRRGFNQAELLARAVAKRTGLGLAPVLSRRGGRGPQVGRGRAERLAEPLAVEVRGSAPRRSLLVDDVVTTGATLAACAAALRKAGTEEVAAIAYARTPGR